MIPLEVVGFILSVLSALTLLVGGLSTLIKNHRDGKKGIVDTQQEGRRDTLATQDKIIDQVQELLGEERNERKEQAAGMQAQLETLRGELAEERMYTDDLREHIYLGKPPPPPARWNATGRPGASPVPPPQHI